MNTSVKALKDDVLDKVSGGVILDHILESIDDTVALYKLLGVKRFEDFKKILTDSYNDDPLSYSTTGSQEDLQELLRLFEVAWNK